MVDVSLVIPLLLAGLTTAQAAARLGVSQRTVQKAVAPFRPPRPDKVDPAQLDQWVKEEVESLGPNYGERMIAGSLRARHPGYSFTRRAVGESLARLFPVAHTARRHWATKRLERGHYHAPHFRYSWHLDLACKLQNFRIYVGAIVDGDSRLCCSLVAILNKLPITIYEQVYLPFVIAYGMPDQLVTDKGREWLVAAFVQHHLSLLANQGQAPTRAAHRFTTSTRNTRVEVRAARPGGARRGARQHAAGPGVGE